ncbi:MAG: CynX/NimT family MFS transporter [Candidatus Bathyarchaeia archaeon]
MDKARPQSWFMLGLAWLIAFSLNSALLSVPPLFGLIQQELGVSFTELSLLLSLVFVVIVLLAIPGGILADTLGVRKTVGIAIALVSVGSLLRSTPQDFQTLLGFSALFAVGYALTLPNLPKLVSQWFPRRLAGTATGIYLTGFPIGATTGLALSFTLNTIFDSWRTVLGIWGTIGLIVAVSWWLLAARTPQVDTHDSPRLTSNALRRVLQMPSIWMVTAINFFQNFIFFIQTGWLPSFYADKGVDAALAGVLVSTLTIANILGVFLASTASDKLGLRRPILWSFSLVSALAAYLLIPSPAEFGWVLMPILGLTQAAGFVFIFLLPVELVKPSEVGSATGIILSVGSVGAILGPLLTGYLRDVTGSFEMIPLLLIFGSLGIVAFAFAVPETGHKRRATIRA